MSRADVDVRTLQKKLLRRLVPHSWRPYLHTLYNRLTWRVYRGDKVKCNCCDGNFRRFRMSVTRGGHRSLMCPRCGSLARHRVDWLYLTTRTDALQGPLRLLHIAPEPCLALPLRRLSNVTYLSADFDSALAMDQVDVRKIQYKDESFDAVICNHVLNVIDDDRAAMRELHRVVKTGGWALLQSSMDLTQEHTAEKENAWDPAGAAGRYEEVFMRWYGRDYATLLEQAGFTVTESDFVKDLPAATKRELGLDPEETIFFCRKLGVPEAGSGSEVRPGQAMSDHIVARHHEAK